jgi:hypothetical protein
MLDEKCSERVPRQQLHQAGADPLHTIHGGHGNPKRFVKSCKFYIIYIIYILKGSGKMKFFHPNEKFSPLPTVVDPGISFIGDMFFLKLRSPGKFVKSTSTQGHLKFNSSSIESLFFFIISDNYKLYIYTIKI